METYSFICETVTNIKEAQELIMRQEGKIKSPCYIKLLTDAGEKHYYAEKSNVRIDGAGWIVIEKSKLIG